MQLTHHSRITVLTLALAFTLPLASFASGTYSARPPRPPASGEKLDSAQYELGKSIYNGKAKLSATPSPVGADAKLAALQASLPAKEAKKTNLTALSGKLSGEQLAALEYYVAHRFPKK
jgi:hypothetical protein